MLQILIGQVANSSRVSSKVQNHDARATSLVASSDHARKTPHASAPSPTATVTHMPSSTVTTTMIILLSNGPPKRNSPFARPCFLPSVPPSSPQDSLFGLC